MINLQQVIVGPDGRLTKEGYEMLRSLASTGGGTGDMTKAVYDADNDGVVDNAEGLGGQTPSWYLDRANHTGTQLAATVSDFNTAADARIAIHEAAADPHPVYLTAAEGNAAYSALGHTHTASQISDSTVSGRAMLMASTAAAQTALLDTFTSGLKGLAPASGGGTTNFLRADGAWAAPPGGGGGDVYAYGQLTSNYTLSSVTTAQKLFNWSTNGALTLATGRYVFECQLYILSMSATSGNGAFGLLGAGTATLANILYHGVGLDNNSPLAAAAQGGFGSVTALSGAAMATAGTGTGLTAWIRGFFNVTAAGTIIPSISLLTAAAAIVQAGSFFHCLRVGDTGSATQGTWS